MAIKLCACVIRAGRSRKEEGWWWWGGGGGGGVVGEVEQVPEGTEQVSDEMYAACRCMAIK